ncbi:carbon-nitrogen hydrolase family protein [Cohnella terricola]|uniref:Carbon-nitrogen hydrolase family protein n=1 Tax=Cohnella terricola TaxID=1289167 RepID=A0A559JIL8_9BACL|nr:carbon-nitrogen hydrolase family protein [Cohnella terricola]TVX99720.1 carbon-nitrogen hydrolase family protein [Cohnella terricola]
MNKLTIATTQYGLTDITSEEQFWAGITEKVRDAAEQGAGMIVFPEYMTAHLLSLMPPMLHDEACHELDRMTDEYVRFFKVLSKETGVAILAGTHICKSSVEKVGASAKFYVNRAFLFFPDGRIETQDKVHLTPEEQIRWPLSPGDSLNVFDTVWGKMAILTCYDIEFPELARAAALRGVEMILCPSYTDSSHGYHRVRYCCQARAVENQLFVALSGLVGALSEERPQVDAGFSQAGLFAPCDLPFQPDGIVQAGDANIDMTVLAEADFHMLRENRAQGAVAPFYDRKPEVYERELRKSGH